MCSTSFFNHVSDNMRHKVWHECLVFKPMSYVYVRLNYCRYIPFSNKTKTFIEANLRLNVQLGIQEVAVMPDAQTFFLLR